MILRSIKGIIVTGAIASLVMPLAACGGSGVASDAGVQLRIQVFPSSLVSFYPQVASEKGIFKKNNLDVSLVPVATATEAVSAMQAGSLDLAPSTSDNFVVAKSKGVDAVAVAANTQESVFQVVASSKYVAAGGSVDAKVKAMAGSPIAVYGRGGGSDRSIDLLFKSAAISAQPDFVIAGGAKTISAFEAGKVDFASDTVQIADLLQAAGQGGTYINCAVDNCGAGQADLSKQLYWTTAKFAAAQPETVKRFITAMDDTAEWVHDPQNKADVVAELKKLFPAPAGIDSDKYANLLYESQLQLLNSTAVDPSIIKTSMDQLLEVGQLKNPVDVKSMVWSGAPVK